MKFIIVLAIFIALAAGNEEENSAYNELEGGGFEGDMYFHDFRSAVKGRRWPNGLLIYRFDSDLGSTQKSRVITAVGKLRSQLAGCITFREYRSGDRAYVLVRNGSGCSATVGYSGGVIRQSLSSRCSVGNIQHEFLHNLGFFHEQSRSDRDSWVTIHFDNIQSGKEGNFRKYTTSNSENFSPYDYGSIMHYPAGAFTRNGQKTIVPKKSLNGKRMGQRNALSSADLQKVKKAYKC